MQLNDMSLPSPNNSQDDPYMGKMCPCTVNSDIATGIITENTAVQRKKQKPKYFALNYQIWYVLWETPWRESKNIQGIRKWEPTSNVHILTTSRQKLHPLLILNTLRQC